MKTVQLGRMKVADYVVEKPVGIRPNGQLIYPSDLLGRKEPPSFGMALASTENKNKLATERLKLEPDFDFGVLDNGGKYSKADVLRHIQTQTPLGQQFVNIEVNYAEYFANQLLGNIPITSAAKVSSQSEKLPGIPNDWKAVSKTHWRFYQTKVLFCENTTDAVTTPAANYRIANVHPVFAARGFDVVSLQGVNDARANFIPQATDSKTVYIGGIGHGNYTVYTGDAFNHILEVGSYGAAEVNGKVLHFLSCETGKTLGPDTVMHGAKGYVGYNENFVFDWANANLYWPCDSQFDISMANGKTIAQAIADTNAKYDAAIASVPGTSTAATLLSDKNLLRSPVSGSAWGGTSVRIYPYMFYYMPFAAYMATTR